MIGAIVTAGMAILDKVLPDKKAAAAAKLKLMELEQNGELKLLEKQTEAVVAEIRSESSLARNWRPLIMLLFGIIIANNFILAPYLKAMGFIHVILDIPPKMWSLMEIGLGGYVIGRTGEKMLKAWKEKS